MKNVVRVGLVLLLYLLVAGCAILPPSPPRMPSPPPPAAPSNPAVVSLLDKASKQVTAGDLEQAGASLERALRIEPRNPLLWQELARIRLEQGNYRQAESLAVRSNGMASGAPGLQAENWRIIGQARTAQGDYQGAQEAFKRAEER